MFYLIYQVLHMISSKNRKIKTYQVFNQNSKNWVICMRIDSNSKQSSVKLEASLLYLKYLILISQEIHSSRAIKILKHPI
jgi:hypothetical protein